MKNQQKFITQDVAIQKVTMLANEFLKEIANAKETFDMTVFYKNLNPVMYSEGLCKTLFAKVQDGFNEFHNDGYCGEMVEHEFLNYPKMRYSIGLRKSNPAYEKLIKRLKRVNNLELKSLLANYGQKLNLINLFGEFPFLKTDFGRLSLIEISYCFHSRIDEAELSDKSSLVIAISFSENTKKENAKLIMHTFKYNLKNLLSSNNQCPKYAVHYVTLNKFIEDVYFERKEYDD